MDENARFRKKEIDAYTKRVVALALKIAKVADKEGKDYLIGSGLAIDFHFGKITRNHHDIDFHPMIEDVAWWIKWFEEQGLHVKEGEDKDFPETWQAFNENWEPIVDMWPFKLMDNFLFVNFNGDYIKDRPNNEAKIVVFENVNIKITDPQRVLDQKWRETQANKQIRPQDAHDFKLFGKKLKIEKKTT